MKYAPNIECDNTNNYLNVVLYDDFMYYKDKYDNNYC